MGFSGELGEGAEYSIKSDLFDLSSIAVHYFFSPHLRDGYRIFTVTFIPCFCVSLARHSSQFIQASRSVAAIRITTYFLEET